MQQLPLSTHTLINLCRLQSMSCIVHAAAGALSGKESDYTGAKFYYQMLYFISLSELCSRI